MAKRGKHKVVGQQVDLRVNADGQMGSEIRSEVGMRPRFGGALKQTNTA